MRGSRVLAAVVAGILLASGGWILLGQREAPPGPRLATIVVAGETIAEVNLDDLTQTQILTLPWPGGGETVIEAQPGRIRVQQADCPDQICVHQGWISHGGLPIVCLPHRLSIEITGGGEGLDAVAG